MLIDEYIMNIGLTIEKGDPNNAEILFKEILNTYGKSIKGFLDGTTFRKAQVNAVINCNIDDPADFLPTNIDYLNDLHVILPKLRKYSEEEKTAIPVEQRTYNGSITNNSINISGSTIEKSSIGHSNKDTKVKLKIWKTIFAILGALAAITTIVTLILQLSGVLN